MADTHDNTRRDGHSKLVYDKELRTIIRVDPNPDSDAEAAAASLAEYEAVGDSTLDVVKQDLGLTPTTWPSATDHIRVVREALKAIANWGRKGGTSDVARTALPALDAIVEEMGKLLQGRAAFLRDAVMYLRRAEASEARLAEAETALRKIAEGPYAEPISRSIAETALALAPPEGRAVEHSVAQEIAAEIVSSCVEHASDYPDKINAGATAIAAALTRARREGHREGMYEAATVSDSFQLDPMAIGTYRISAAGRPYSPGLGDHLRALAND